ncbi:hypothetical protein Hanom_Chr02g00132841 [Helianthus anomalus]
MPSCEGHVTRISLLNWMALGARSEIKTSFIDQGVKWLFLTIWGKTVKTTNPHGAKRKFTLLSTTRYFCQGDGSATTLLKFFLLIS